MAREKTNLPAEIFEEEAPVTEEEIKEEIVFNENELLKALTDETQHEDTIETIEVIFGKTKFSFRIRPLSEKEWISAASVTPVIRKPEAWRDAAT